MSSCDDRGAARLCDILFYQFRWVFFVIMFGFLITLSVYLLLPMYVLFIFSLEVKVKWSDKRKGVLSALCVCFSLIAPKRCKGSGKGFDRVFTSLLKGLGLVNGIWVLKLEIVPCQAPAASLCEWVNWQGHWDRIGRGNMWEGEGQIELEDVHSSWLALCHMAVAMTMQQLS